MAKNYDGLDQVGSSADGKKLTGFLMYFSGGSNQFCNWDSCECKEMNQEWVPSFWAGQWDGDVRRNRRGKWALDKSQKFGFEHTEF